MEPKLHLGAASLNNCKALLIPVSSKLVPEMLLGLVDSGSLDSFIDSEFVTNNKLAYQDIEPHPLSLIDGTVNNCVNWTVTLPMKFPCGASFQIKFFVTSLDGSCEVVLGHNWLMVSNPQIDWEQGTIRIPKLWRNNTPRNEWLLTNIKPTPTLETPWPQISWVNVTTYECLRRKKGNTAFQINPVLGQESLVRSACIDPVNIDLRDVPHDYHEFADVFSKQGAKRLPQHWQFDLSIQIESEKTPPLGPIYSLSSLKLQTLRDFIDKNLKTGLIRLSWSPCGASVLFVKKKDGSL